MIKIKWMYREVDFWFWFFIPSWLMHLSEEEATSGTLFLFTICGKWGSIPNRPSPETKLCFSTLILDFQALPLSITGMYNCPMWRQFSVAKSTQLLLCWTYIKFPVTHMVAHNCLPLQCQGISCPLCLL